MNAKVGKISFLQACAMLMLMNGLNSHVIVNPLLLDASGRDAWLAVLCTGLFFLPWLLLLVFIMRRTGQTQLRVWLSERLHPAVSWLLVAPACLQLYFIGGMTVIHTTTWTITNYLPATPKLVLIATLCIVCLACTLSGLRVIAISSGILLPFVIALGYFVGFSNMSEKDFKLLRPIAEHGVAPIVHGMVYAGGGLIEVLVLLAMQHRLKGSVNSWKLLLFGVISLYIMLGPIIGAITEFGPKEAAMQLESPYEQWRLVKLGTYVEHVDFFSIFQWMSGATIRISLAAYLLVELLAIRSAAVRRKLIFAIMASYALFSLLPVNEYTFFLWMYHYYFPISLIVGFAITLAWFAASLRPKLAEEGTT